MVRLALAVAAAAFGIAAASPAHAGSPAPVYNWTGFYIGGEAGARWHDSQLKINAIDQWFFNNTVVQHDLPDCTFDLIPCKTNASPGAGAARIGSYAGYNLQFAERWLAGIEANWAWANASATQDGFKFFIGNPPPDSSFTVKTSWDASLRARLGFLAAPGVLLYATGGAAWINTEITSDCGPVTCFPGTVLPLTVKQSSVRSGWTAGAGVESMFAQHWLVRAEYRYADFGSASYQDIRPCTQQPGCNGESSLNVAYDLALRTHTFSVGLAYKFGQP
jgi:outer membrane immunogenic protein